VETRQRAISRHIFSLLAVAAFLSARVLAGPIDPALIISPGLVDFTVAPGTIFNLNAPEGYFGTKNGKPSDAVIDPGFQFGTGTPSSFTGSRSNLDAGIVSIQDFHFSIRMESSSAKLPQCCSGSVVMKTEGATFTATGQQQNVPIEILSFSLQDVTPLQITYGGVFPTFFDVFVTLDPNSTQHPGSLSMTSTDSNSGIFSITLPVAYQIRFSDEDPGGPSASPMNFNGDFTGSGAFTTVPEPGTLSLLTLGVGGGGWLYYHRKRSKLDAN